MGGPGCPFETAAPDLAHAFLSRYYGIGSMKGRLATVSGEHWSMPLLYSPLRGAAARGPWLLRLLIGKGPSPRSMQPTLVASAGQLRARPMLGLGPRIAAVEFGDAGTLLKLVIIRRVCAIRHSATSRRNARSSGRF